MNELGDVDEIIDHLDEAEAADGTTSQDNSARAEQAVALLVEVSQYTRDSAIKSLATHFVRHVQLTRQDAQAKKSEDSIASIGVSSAPFRALF